MQSHIKRSRGRPRSTRDGGEKMLIRSLDRAMHLLEILAAGNGMSLTEIADASGETAPTAYRILMTLQRRRLVEFEEAAQIWHVGLETFRIGSNFLRRTHIVERSRPVMQWMVSASGETANLAIVDRAEVIFVSQVETHLPIRAFFRPGTRGPIHASGVGKALLAFFPQPQLDAILSGGKREAFTDKTIVDGEQLRRELAAIRRRGWAIDDEEHTPGMRCIAAPIFNHAGEAIAGISVSGPSVRITPKQIAKIGPLVKAAADEITASIGGNPSGMLAGVRRPMARARRRT